MRNSSPRCRLARTSLATLPGCATRRSHAAGGGCRLNERKGWRRTAKHVSARAVRWSRLRQCGRLASCTGSCGKQGIGGVDHGRRSRDGVIGQAPSYPAQPPCNTSTMSGSAGVAVPETRRQTWRLDPTSRNNRPLSDLFCRGRIGGAKSREPSRY